MINIKITMVDGTEYNIKNIGDSIKDAFKRIVAPYGTNMSFVEILPRTLISVDNIVSMRELSEEEVISIKQDNLVGLTETEVKVEDAKPVNDFFDGNVMDAKRKQRQDELERKRVSR